MSKKYNNVRRVLNYFEHFLVFISAVSGCFSISVFASLVGVPVGIASSTVELKICALNVGIKSYKSIKIINQHDNMVLFAKKKKKIKYYRSFDF